MSGSGRRPPAWSLDAAKAPLTPAPSRPAVHYAPSRDCGAMRAPRRWPVIAAAAAAVLVLAVLGLAVARWVHLGVAPAVPAATAAKPAAAALLVPLAGPPAAGTPAVAATEDFPGGTTAVYVSVHMALTAPSPVLTFSVAVQSGRATHWTQLTARTFVLDAGTATVVPIASAAGAFNPGTYTVTAAMNGAAVGSTRFVVD